MRALVVVNPAAGHGRCRRVWQRIGPQLLGREPDLAWVATTRPGEARELGRAAAVAGLERVVVVGGDGTVGEVAGGLVGSETVLGIVPGGTGNDLCAELGLPANPLAAAWLALTAQRTRAVDLGEVRTHGRGVVFANVAGLGFDAAAVRRVRATPHLGLLGGSLSYVIGALRALRGFHPRPLRLALDGQPLERTVFLAAVAITRRYAGGIRIAPHAILDDGLFDVCLVGDLRPAEVLRVLPRLYRGGHCRHPQVEFFRCRELRAESVGPARVGWHADGEPLGELPAVFRVRPERLRYVVGELPARFSRGRRGSKPQPPSASARGPTVR